jgi:hypothetical protein
MTRNSNRFAGAVESEDPDELATRNERAGQSPFADLVVAELRMVGPHLSR